MHRTPDRHQQVGEFFAVNDGSLHRAVARSITAPRALIDDACANAWVILLGRPDITLDPRGLCWLTTVATNEALRLLRRSRGETPVGSFHGDLRGHDHDVREPGDSDAPGADERALARIEHAERVEAFRQLKPREREALYLKALRYSYNDIARLTDSTYRSHDAHHLPAPGCGDCRLGTLNSRRTSTSGPTATRSSGSCASSRSTPATSRPGSCLTSRAATSRTAPSATPAKR